MRRNTTWLAFVFLLVALIAIPAALAGNVETNTFVEVETGNPVTNVQMLVYECTDTNEQCVTVTGDPIVSRNSGSTNRITVEYPGTAAPTDYAEYFYAQGYLPMAFVVPNDWGTGQTFSYDVEFKKANGCSAPIDGFTIQNEVYADEPLQVNIRALLDTDAHSAFRDPGTPPFFVPDVYKDEYYSAETEVTLNIYNPIGGLAYSETRTLNLFMDTEQNVLFTWVPASRGVGYTAEVVTDVVDDQCASSTTQSTMQEFIVLQNRPQNECYVLLNNLEASNVQPTVGEDVDFTYTKISNYADDNFDKTAVPMVAEYVIRKGQTDVTGELVSQGGASVPATSTSTPTLFEFDWTFDESGWYTIFVTGQADDDLCSAVPNYEETVSMELYVDDRPLNDVIFTVRDLNSQDLVEGASVLVDAGTIALTALTNSNGRAVVADIAPGAYTYIVAHPDYSPVTGSFNMGTVNLYIDVQLARENRGPLIELDPIDPLTIVAGSSVVVDFGPYVSDDDDTDDVLRLDADSNIRIHEVIDENSRNTYSANGIDYDVELLFTEYSGAQFKINGEGTGMLVSGDDYVLSNGATLHLKKSATDVAEFYLGSAASDVTVTIRNWDTSLLIDTTSDATGEQTFTFTVTDPSGATAEDTLTVVVASDNDAPTLTGLPDITLDEDESLFDVFNLRNFADDRETLRGDLDFSLSPNSCGVTLDSNNNVDIQPSRDWFGICTITATVIDAGGLEGTDSFIVTVNPVNDAPFIDSTPLFRATVGVPYFYDVQAFDVDGDVLTFSLNQAPAGMTIEPVTGDIDWIPTVSQVGDHEVTVVVDDGDLIGFQVYSITVGSDLGSTPNTLPVITSTPVTVAEKDELYTYDVDAFDPDAWDTVTYSLVERPTGMTIDSDNGFIRWTPRDEGTFDVTVRVTDSFGGSATQSFQITVTKGTGSGSGDGSIGLIFSRTRAVSGEYVSPGDILEFSIEITNQEDVDLEDVRLTLYVYDWGEWRTVGPFDVEQDDSVSKKVFVPVPDDIESGDVDVRLVVSNDEIKHVLHRLVTIR